MGTLSNGVWIIPSPEAMGRTIYRSISGADRENLMSGAVQHPNGFDFRIPRLWPAGEREHLQGPLFCLFDGIRADHDAADDPTACFLRGHRLDTIDFKHAFQNSNFGPAPCHALTRWSFSNRLINRSRFNFD